MAPRLLHLLFVLLNISVAAAAEVCRRCQRVLNPNAPNPSLAVRQLKPCGCRFHAVCLDKAFQQLGPVNGRRTLCPCCRVPSIPVRMRAGPQNQLVMEDNASVWRGLTVASVLASIGAAALAAIFSSGSRQSGDGAESESD